MQYKRYAIELELTGITRKKAAEILSSICQAPLHYLAGGDNYLVQDCFNRDWRVSKSADISCQRNVNGTTIGANFLYSVKLNIPFVFERDFSTIAAIIASFHESGGLINDTTKMNIQIESNEHGERYQGNLRNIMESKGDLLFKAVQSQSKKPIDISDISEHGVVNFPMFHSTLSVDQLKSYLQLSVVINQQALTKNRISPRRNESPNEKYTFRTWLLRLGMIGSEFKTTRAVLMENLEGNCAWRNPVVVENQIEEKESLAIELNEVESDLKLML